MKQIVNMVIDSYIKVMGRAKWDSLTAQEQHDVIMILVRDMGNVLKGA